MKEKKVLDILKSGDLDALKALLAGVTKLNLGSSNLTGKEALLLAAALKSNQSLTTLSLSSNQIGATGGAAIDSAIARNLAEQRLAIEKINYHRIETFPKYLEMSKLENKSSNEDFYLIKDCTDRIFTFLLDLPVTDSEQKLSGASEELNHDNA